MGSRSPDPRAAVMLLAVVACLALAPAAGAASQTEMRLLTLINEARAKHLSPPLRLNSKLEQAAHAHSSDMLARNYFDHGNLRARLRGYGVTSSLIGENLAWASGRSVAPGTIVRMWLTSAPHRQVMLLRKFHRVGLALPVGPFLGYEAAVVVTADFST